MNLKYRLMDEAGMPEESTYSVGRVLNISEGGMLIEVDRIIRLGQKLEVYARIENSSTGTYGIVVAVRQAPDIDVFEIGVKFQTRETF